jgi:alginate O-acetyltransferase complex protein AlgJ
MADQILESPIRRSQQPGPRFLVFSRRAPLPEKREKASREEEAEQALKSTFLAPGACMLLVTLFLLTLAIVPVLQLVTELQTRRAGNSAPMFEVFNVLPTWAKICNAHNPAELWNLWPRADELKSAEKAMENQSIVSIWLRSRIQWILTGFLHAGTEQVYPGRDGWLFYRADVDYVTGPPFLDAAQLKRRAKEAGVQPDPVTAIADFRNQLATRGIDLIVMPVPAKPTVDGEMLAARARQSEPLQNASFADFKARLQRDGVRVFDPAPLLMERKAATSGAPLYLETDTHWRPETMEFVAGKLAGFIGSPSSLQSAGLRVLDKQIAACGDILQMLKLPATQTIYLPQKITIKQVLEGNMQWCATRDARVLLLGDSFCNIFSLEPMGWGESAGFAEHLSRAMGGQPLDCILRNSDAAFATREILSRDLACGRDRLAGKKLVVWEFAVRELMFGNWKLLDIKPRQPQITRFFAPGPGEQTMVTGTVEAVSPVPLAGTVPYKDHILTVHLVDVTGPQARQTESFQALVCLWSMRDNVWTPAARLRPGERVSVRLRAWADVSAQYEKINRSEIEDPAVQLEEPAWGDLLN